MKQREDRIVAYAKKYVTEAGERIVQLYDAWGQPEPTAEWRKKLTPASKK